ncbi:MAG: undecaprenyldiphospho-muramoylpentapeptide beta-N-acetylglucosaminyltransferase [Campylobacterota bacterium]|nr:undecaprenyldiphospho-muramoylpentapeptide beta-N-acetylglucosaminyltransferase [Campylobacterota bacterium]
MTFLITGGGTGGHLSIAASLLNALKERGHKAIYIGSMSGQDQKWFLNEMGFEEKYFFETTGVVNQRGLGKLKALFKIFKAFFKSRKLIKNLHVDAVISVGGFSAAPASFAAVTLKVPFFIHEQNAVTGRLNALLQSSSSAFFSSYDETSPIKGYPVNTLLFKTAHIRKDIKTIIFLGGSQGAQFINDLALKMAPELNARGINIIHQSGERDYERLKNEYKRLNIHVDLFGFTKELSKLLEQSDLAISRAGASTLWELCANGLPAFYIPYPYAAGDHQFYNAKFLVDKNLAWCERQSDDLHVNILKVLDEDISKMSEGLTHLGGDNASQEIVEYIEGVVTC